MHQFSENLFQNAIDLNDTIVFEYNAGDDVITFSENVKKYILVPVRIPAFVEKMSYLGKIFDSDIEKAISYFTSGENPDKVRMEYIRFLDFAGEYCWYQLKGRVEVNDSSRPVSVYGTLAYVDDETKHQEEEKTLTRDPLTKLLNDDSFSHEVAVYIEEMPNDVIPNLMIVDLDDFAEWPKMYSEISSDGVLIEIARILKRAFRGSDVIGRIDVDRFGILMKGVRGTNILLERAAYIRQTVKDVWSDFTNNGFITVSIGIASMHGKEATMERLKARALSALNDAKSGGKDNYVLYTSDMERLDTSVNPILSTKEMEMIRNILDPMSSWAYAVDDNYQLLYRNEVLETRLQNKCEGMCYAQIKGYAEPPHHDAKRQECLSHRIGQGRYRKSDPGDDRERKPYQGFARTYDGCHLGYQSYEEHVYPSEGTEYQKFHRCQDRKLQESCGFVFRERCIRRGSREVP